MQLTNTELADRIQARAIAMAKAEEKAGKVDTRRMRRRIRLVVRVWELRDFTHALSFSGKLLRKSYYYSHKSNARGARKLARYGSK